MMLITLYTSRVILESLGEIDYGIYNVVGGVVAVCSIISGPLSASITRFLTYELGTNNKSAVANVFCTALNIQFVVSFVIFLICEVVGVWFLYTYINIPEDRMDAAFFALQCSLLTFVINLLIVPYNAFIISVEKMNVFAYLSIIEASIRLGIAYLIMISPIDRLKLYSIMLVFSSLVILCVYIIYCTRKYKETKFKICIDKSKFAEMFSFACWNLLGNASWVVNTQGVNMLMNVFFGVKVNTARAIAVQVEGAVNQFVNSFTTAINPQITKSFAQNNLAYYFSLINKGSKYSFYILYYLVVPIVLEASTILSIWLVQIPDYTIVFLRLVVISSLAVCMGNSLTTAIMSTGKIKRYEIIISICASLVFPFSWIAFKVGLPAYSTFIIFGIIYFSLNFIRLFTLKVLTNFPIKNYIENVLLRIILVALAGTIVPICVHFVIYNNLVRLLAVVFSSICWTSIVIYVIGLESVERNFVNSKIIFFLKKRRNVCNI